MAEKIITFSGKQYSGKDTAAKILLEELKDFKRCAMGDIIKIEYGKLHNLSYEEFHFCIRRKKKRHADVSQRAFL